MENKSKIQEETTPPEATDISDSSAAHLAFILQARAIKHGVVTDAQGAIIGRVLAAGSIIYLHGQPVELKTDAVIAFAGMESEQKFAGLLVGNPANFQANASELKGNYNPLNAALMPNDCQNCGRAIPFESADQKTCSAVCADALREKETGTALIAESAAIPETPSEKPEEDPKAHLAQETPTQRTMQYTNIPVMDTQSQPLKEVPATVLNPANAEETEVETVKPTEADPRSIHEMPEPDTEISH